MVDATQRVIVIREIYERYADDYKDVRRLYKTRDMRLRLHMLDVSMRQHQAGTQEHRRLDNEKALLKKKLEIYTNSRDLPQCGFSPHPLLRLTDLHPEDDEETPEVAATNKKKHTIILLHYMFIEKSYEELVALRDE